jgi:hypothetical protein
MPGCGLPLRAPALSGNESIELGRSDPVALAQHVDDAPDDRPIRFQHSEHFVLRALDNFGNILLGNTPGTAWTSIKRDFTILVPADR